MVSHDIITPKRKLEEKSRDRSFGTELRFEELNENEN